jgi:ABC-type antimicrobial peptide transport system permease subunit
MILALVGGTIGIAFSSFVVFLFHNLIVQLTGVPFLFPALLPLLGLALGILALVLASVILATLFPIWRIAHGEPGTGLKEW